MKKEISSNLVLKHILLALSKDNIITYGDDDDNELCQSARNLKEEDTSVDLDMEQCTRDLFYSSGGALKTIINALKDYENETDDGFSLAKSIGVENAEVVFSSSKMDEGGEDYEILIACRTEEASKNWLISLSTFMGEYCDEDYDLNISLNVFTHLDRSAINEKVSEVSNRWVSYAVSEFDRAIDRIKKSLPQDLRGVADDEVLSLCKNNKIFQPVLAHKEKEEINAAIADERSTNKKKKSSKM